MPNSAILTAETEKTVTETASEQSQSTSLEDILYQVQAHQRESGSIYYNEREKGIH